jgi:hypothetical protein
VLFAVGQFDLLRDGLAAGRETRGGSSGRRGRRRDLPGLFAVGDAAQQARIDAVAGGRRPPRGPRTSRPTRDERHDDTGRRSA